VKTFKLAFVFTCLCLVILHPYTTLGKPGFFVAIIFALYGVYHGVNRQFAIDFMAPVAVLVLISFVGVLSSVMNGIFQLNHLWATSAFGLLLLTAHGLWVYCQRCGISKDEVIVAVLFVIVLNSLIIAFELFFPSLRLFIEDFLDPLKGGSINYAEGFRLRGLASSGGAGLSISVPAALVISFYLYDRKSLSLSLMLPIIIILLFFVMVIGRTGLFLSAVTLMIYATVFIFKLKWTVNSMSRVLILVPMILLGAIYVYHFFEDFFTLVFGASFIEYTYGFFLKGGDAIAEEGTIPVVIKFLNVLPLELPQALVGYGFYGGSGFSPWTDSGYARMFMSVGFIFGLSFYVILYRIYFRGFRGHEFFVGTLILLLSIAEVKEPLLYSGVASRMFIFILVFCWFDNYLRSRGNTLAVSCVSKRVTKL